MSLTVTKTNSSINGKDIFLFRIQNESGAYVEVLNYGATLVSFVVPDKSGNLENIILNYNNIEDYFTDNSYIGSTVGRFANRIGGAQFELNGIKYSLDRNDGNNCNHGGYSGFNSKVFDWKVENEKLILSCESLDGEGGFPGNLKFSVIYSFSAENSLYIEYKAVSDTETVFNPTNHAYFNLSAGRENILNHELKVFSESYLETDDEFIPTGKVLPIGGSAFDFRRGRRISEMMPLKTEILQGYNTYFIGNSDKQVLKHLASLSEEESGRYVDVYSTMPGVQVYTGDYLPEPFTGVCLEAQFYPDGPNHPHFETCMLKPDTETVQIIVIDAGCRAIAHRDLL
ncbi:aldose epimerase family protein [Dysgonomonas sp. 520]|uniref:aldose epimerase family protein n=1 Tax=Dysgonomonas sp. 520 TaxID=2302931 RepID=UPI0013D70921|nr:aldose epimerase family protein [Dysgonomonas sp. 520]NDW08586.1 galactose mutarotase [Dysgonomonas sp. 520]